MAKRMKGVPLIGKTGFREIICKHLTSSAVGHAGLTLGVKEELLMSISHREPCLQSTDRIITEIHNPPQSILLPLLNINPSILEVEIQQLCVEQLSDSHSRS